MKTEAKFENVFQEQLENLFDAEKQIVEALPKMAVQATSEELAGAFQECLDQTKEQLTRLQIIFGRIGMEPSRKCEAIEALLREGEKSIAAFEKSAALDFILVSVASQVEHFQMATYSAACALAESLGQQDAFDLLQTTLHEETESDDDLSEIAEAILSGDVDRPPPDTVIAEEERSR